MILTTHLTCVDKEIGNFGNKDSTQKSNCCFSFYFFFLLILIMIKKPPSLDESELDLPPVNRVG